MHRNQRTALAPEPVTAIMACELGPRHGREERRGAAAAERRAAVASVQQLCCRYKESVLALVRCTCELLIEEAEIETRGVPLSITSQHAFDFGDGARSSTSCEIGVCTRLSSSPEPARSTLLSLLHLTSLTPSSPGPPTGATSSTAHPRTFVDSSSLSRSRRRPLRSQLRNLVAPHDAHFQGEVPKLRRLRPSRRRGCQQQR